MFHTSGYGKISGKMFKWNYTEISPQLDKEYLFSPAHIDKGPPHEGRQESHS